MTATPGEGAFGNGVGVTTPTAHKMAQTTEFVKTTTKNVIRPGVLYNGDSSLVAGTANMSYDVDPFSIVTQRSATAGVMKWTNDATYNVATTAAPGSNSRIDTVYAWHREYAIDGTDSNPVIAVAQGTAAASPTAPSLAAYPGAIELARIVVPAGVTATNSGTTFTQNCPFTTVDGGRVAFRTTTEMDLWLTAITDQRALDLSTGATYRWNGSAWKIWDQPSPTNLTLATGWAAFDVNFSAPDYSVHAGRVWMNGGRWIRTGSTLAVSGGGIYDIITVAIPTALRPAEMQVATGVLGIAGTIAACQTRVTTAGIIQFQALAAGTISTAGGEGNQVSIPPMSWLVP